MKNIYILPSFERSLKKLTPIQKKLVAGSLEEFNAFLTSGRMSAGFGLKKINHDKFEFRVDIKLRIIVKVEEGNYYLILAGNHDDIKRYLRRFR
ncbi:MAG: hypothetical protein NC914_02925 [Candidatus Omnitrophica bacterium]|nr:hypothetical protein [Candidatus Omnitrophota bacterium]